MSARRLLTVVGALACAMPSGCTTPDPDIVYDAYGGTAYPDKRPKLPKPEGYFAYVSENGSDTISVIDLPRNVRVAQVAVGRDPVDLDGPHHLAVDAKGFVYLALQYPQPTSLPGPHSAHASSTRKGWVVKLAPDDLRILAQVQVDANPGEIVLSPDGTKLLVTHFDLQAALNPSASAEDQKSTVAIIETASFDQPVVPAPRFVKTCRATHGAAITADGRTAFVACYADNALAIVDLVTPGAPVTQVSVGVQGPYSAVASPSGRLLAVGATDGRETRLFDTTTRTPTSITVITPGASYFAAWSADEKTLWIPTQGPDAIVAANAETGAAIRQRRFEAGTCEKPHEATLGRGEGALLYVVCEGDHKKNSVILGLDPTTLETKATIDVGVYPDRMAFTGTP